MPERRRSHRLSLLRRRATGAADLFATGLSTLVMAIFSVASINMITTYTSESNARLAAEEQLTLARSVGQFIQANAAATIALTSGTPGCSYFKDNSTGWTFFKPDWLPVNATAAGGSSTCGSVFSTHLATAPGQQNQSIGAVFTNRYGQEYWVAIRPRTYPTNQSSYQNQHTTLEAVLITRNGPAISDDTLGTMVSRIGPSGGAVYNSQPNGIAANNLAMYGRSYAGLASSYFTPGHSAIFINALTQNSLDDNLHKDGEPGDTEQNRMDASMYMANADSGDMTKPVNVNMNGAPSVFAAANIQTVQAATNNGTGAPHNGIFGARQVDTQTLTAGNSMANQYSTNADQTNAENQRGQTVNDAGNKDQNNQFLYPNTILSNANFDVTEGYRLTAADGLHITASNGTVRNDDNMGTDEGAANHESATYQSGSSVAGVSWDNATNQAGGLSRIGLMEYLSGVPRGPAEIQNQYGTYNVWQVQNVIATYNRDNDGTKPVGFEADGGFRAPVYYDSRSMDYFLAPQRTSRLGDIALDQNGAWDPMRNKAVSGQLFTSGLVNVPYPTGWGGGVLTFDLYSANGTIAVGCRANQTDGRCENTTDTSYISAFMDASGKISTNYYINTGMISIQYIEVQGNHCLNDKIPYMDDKYNQYFPDQHENRGAQADTITYGTISKDSNGQPMYCSGSTGNWEYASQNPFSQLVNSGISTTGSFYNNSGKTQLIEVAPASGVDRYQESGLQGVLNGAVVCYGTLFSSANASGLGGGSCTSVIPPGSTFTFADQSKSGGGTGNHLFQWTIFQ